MIWQMVSTRRLRGLRLRALRVEPFGQPLTLTDRILHRGMFPSAVATDRVDAPSLQLAQDCRYRTCPMPVEVDIGVMQIFDVGDDDIIVRREDTGPLHPAPRTCHELFCRMLFSRSVRHFHV